MHKALIVDDSRAMRLILGRTLQRFGYDVREAVNGIEALKLMEQNVPPVDVILVDWNMPEMNGLDFIRTLRADSRHAAIPIVMVTTETDTDQMLAALEAGANEYVMKPFTEEAIAGKLRLVGVLPESSPSHG